MEKIIYAYLSLDEDYYIGDIFVESLSGKDVVSFEFSEEFLKSPYSMMSIDPELAPYKGRQYCQKEIFGFLEDSSPDRWGRVLLRRREMELAKEEKRRPKNLSPIDYMLGVYDSSRMGAIRFKTDKDGPFLSDDKDGSIPPWVFLRTLEKYASDFEYDETIDSDWVKNLLIPGSSLGGARPKANVYSPDGEIWIAKFPSKKDDYDVGAWEATANELAMMCHLDVPSFETKKFSKYGTTFLSKRFDRKDGKRIHFESAMTALNAKDGESSDYSYLDIANFIKSNSSQPKRDLRELFRRVVFNMAINNNDDHLRNHGFILKNKAYVLSPLYDINPSPYGENLSLCISNNDSHIDSKKVIESAVYYDISFDEATTIHNEIVDIVNSNWKRIAIKYGISEKCIEDMSPAFSLEKYQK